MLDMRVVFTHTHRYIYIYIYIYNKTFWYVILHRDSFSFSSDNILAVKRKTLLTIAEFLAYSLYQSAQMNKAIHQHDIITSIGYIS